jgi:hypothetical protein
MAWIEVHQSLQRHPKLLRLSAKLRIHKAQSAGHLLFLWLWTLDYAPTGDLSAFGPAEISAAAECSFDPEIFLQALRETGWIDPNGVLHDWYDYAGKLIERRAADKERKRDVRKNPQSVPGTSDGRRTDGARTVPNPTLPNQTLPEEKPEAAAPGALGFRIEARSEEAAAHAAHAKQLAKEAQEKARPKKAFPPDSLEYKGAVFFWSYLREWSPQAIEPTEAGYQSWARDIDAMYRLDGRSTTAYNELLDWIDTQKESYSGFSWRKNIHSPAKLRQRWKEGKFADFLPSELAREEFR